MEIKQLEKKLEKEHFYDRLISYAAPAVISAGALIGIYGFLKDSQNPQKSLEAFSFFFKYAAPLMLIAPVMVWTRVLQKKLMSKSTTWEERIFHVDEMGGIHSTYQIGRKNKEDKPAYSVHFNTTGNNSLFEVGYTDDNGEKRYSRYTPEEFCKFLMEKNLPQFPKHAFEKFERLFRERHENSLESNCY